MPRTASDPANSLKVFISYSRKDVEFTRRLAAALESRGITPVMDTRDLPALEDWRRELLSLIRQADAVVFVISPRSVASAVCAWEVEQVGLLNKRLAPIVIERVPDDRIPEAVSKINYLFLDDPAGFEVMADALATALSTNLAWLKDHTRLGELARRWDQRNRKGSLLLREQELIEAERWITSHPRGAPEPTALHRKFVQHSRRQSTRRFQLIISGSLALSIAALALAGFAFWQRQIARDETARAERNFTAAKSAADGLINDLAKNLRNVRGVSQETTRTVLTTADKVMERLVANSEATPALLLSQIELFQQFAQTYWFVGDVTNALAYTDRTLDIADRVGAETPDPAVRLAALRHRYDALIEKGDILRVMGALDNSLESFIRSRETAQQIIALDPGRKIDTWRQLARAHGRIGDVLRTFRRFDDAGREYREAEAIQGRFLDASPDDPEWLLELSWTHNRIGDNLLQITNHEGLMTVAPDRTAAQRDNPNLSEALRNYRRAVAIRRHLVRLRTKDYRARRDLIWSLALTGMAELAVDIGQGRRLLAEAHDEAEAGLGLDPQNTELLRYQANVFNFRGDAALLEGRSAEAFADYGMGLAIRKRLAATDPSNARWARDLFYTLKRMVDLNRIAGETGRAEAYRAEALQAFDRVAPKFPNDQVLAEIGAALKQPDESRAEARARP